MFVFNFSDKNKWSIIHRYMFIDIACICSIHRIFIPSHVFTLYNYIDTCIYVVNFSSWVLLSYGYTFVWTQILLLKILTTLYFTFFLVLCFRFFKIIYLFFIYSYMLCTYICKYTHIYLFIYLSIHLFNYLSIHLFNNLQNTGGNQVRSENIKFNVGSERQ